MTSTGFSVPGLRLIDHEVEVPLDHDHPERGRLKLFARECVAGDRERTDELPWLLFLQGGPGFGAPRPTEASGWLKRAVRDYRVLLLDQRGTGRSSPVSHQTLARLPDPAAQAGYLACFRADAIVRDAEHLRGVLAGGRPWTLLGQSYGGFCAVHYLSAFPEGLQEVILTGGLPSLEASAAEVYRHCYPLVRERNQRFFRAWPADRERVQTIVGLLLACEQRLPGGDPLSARRFQQLGLLLGAHDGAARLHYLLEEAVVEGARGPELSWTFLRGVENALSFDTNPIYSLLHESCYAQERATDWAAETVLAEFPEFRPPSAAGTPLLFTGEMVYPWMFEEYATLRPLSEAADLLAARADWPRLYDVERLERNRVPVVAALYAEDMYVPRELSEATARRIGSLRVWTTNEHEHNGLRASGEAVLGRLLDMLRGRV